MFDMSSARTSDMYSQTVLHLESKPPKEMIDLCFGLARSYRMTHLQMLPFVRRHLKTWLYASR